MAEPSATPAPRRTGLVVSVAAALLALLVYRGYGPQFQTRPTDAAPKPVDLNTADRTELLQVPGVGPALADAILEHRTGQRFETVEELAAVKGIGPKTVEKLRPFVRAEPATDVFLARGASPEVETLERKPPSAATGKIQPGEPPINVNTASAEQLQRLPGIGATLAARIITTREERRFKTVDELRRVGGIGAKTLDKLRPFVVVE